MARTIKKVKAKTPKNLKKWIIISSISVVLVAAITLTILYFTIWDDYDYFEDQQDAYISHNSLKDKINGSVEEIFIFVYDDTFDPEDDETDEDIEDEIMKLYDIAQDKTDIMEFYIVYADGRNADILTDATFGATETVNSLIYMYDGSYETYACGDTKGNVYKDPIAGSSLANIKAARVYAKSYIS